VLRDTPWLVCRDTPRSAARYRLRARDQPEPDGSIAVRVTEDKGTVKKRRIPPVHERSNSTRTRNSTGAEVFALGISRAPDLIPRAALLTGGVTALSQLSPLAGSAGRFALNVSQDADLRRVSTVPASGIDSRERRQLFARGALPAYS